MEDQDSKFRDNFSQLAYSALQNKFPDLLRKSVGFQVLDSNDNHTKGLGVTVLSISGRSFYIPVFFVMGNIKPLELLYSKDEDVFMPLDKEFVSSILKGETVSIGDSVKLPRVGLSNPNLELYANPPRTGRTVTASDNSIVEDVFNLSKKAEDPSVPLPLFISCAPSLVKRSFANLLKNNKDYFGSLLEHYEWEVIKQALATDPDPEFEFSNVDIITDKLDKKASPEVVREIIEDGYAILDKRASCCDAYFTQGISRLNSISDSGVYQIIDRYGNVKNYLVLQEEDDRDRDMSNNQGYHQGTFTRKLPAFHKVNRKVKVIDLGEGKLYRVESGSLLGKRNFENTELIDAIINSLPDVTDLSPTQDYVLITRKGESICGTECFNVLSKDVDLGQISYLASISGVDKPYKRLKIVVSDKTKGALGKPKEGVLLVSKDIKAIPISRVSNNPEEKFPGVSGSGVSEAFLERQAVDKGVGKVRLFFDGVDFELKSPFISRSQLSKEAAVKSLVLELNMSKRDVKRLVKSAEDSGESSCFLVKEAIPMNYQQPVNLGPQYAPIPVQQLTNPPIQQQRYWPEQYFRETYNPIPPTRNRDGYRLNIGPDNIAEQPVGSFDSSLIGAAVNTGDRNILEAGTIASLAKTSDIDDMIESYLPDLTKAMDKVGRMLFMFFYQSDKFSDKYSLTELKETEESIRNLFKDLGKLINKFKAKKTKVYGMLKNEQ